MKCKRCQHDFGHWCTSCGWDSDTHCYSEGYCSNECLIAEGGRTYEQICASDDELVDAAIEDIEEQGLSYRPWQPA